MRAARRSTGFAALCVTTALAGIALSAAPAQAAFVCTGTFGVTAVTCTNPTTDIDAPFTANQTGAFALTTTNSGTSDGIDTHSVDGNNITNNTGTVTADISTAADGTGHATTNNTGSAANVAGQILTFTALSGNATTINSGAAGSISTVTETGGNASTTNTGAVGFGGIVNIAGATSGGGDATVTNSGTVDGQIMNVAAPTGGAGNALTANSGTVNGDVTTLSEDGDATINNRGTVNGDVTVIGGFNAGAGSAGFVNSGTINGFNGVTFGSFTGNSVGYNSGRINGGVHGTNFGGGSVVFSNAGTIAGFPGLGGFAIDISQVDPTVATTLNILPGSRITGLVFLSGDILGGMPGSTVNIATGRDISQVLTFGDPSGGCGCSPGNLLDTGSVVNVTGGAPYVISGNSVAWLDPTSFANSDRNFVDVTRTISSVISGRLASPVPLATDTSLGFAPTRSVVQDMTRDAFASVAPLAYTSGDRVPMSPLSSAARDGTSVWAQGFAGARTQRAEGITLRSVNNFYGGMLGVDKMVRSDLRLGAFVGAGEIKSDIAMMSGDTESRLVFGALYGRKWIADTFVDFALLAGHTRDHSKRLVANNLAPSGFEFAAADYNSWFVSPEIALGMHYRLSPGLTLLPVLRARYLGIGHSGYAETGSLASLTVASRSTGFFEERAEVSLIRSAMPSHGHFMQVSGTIGVLGLHRAGDADVNSTLLGQTLAFTVPGQTNAFGGFAGTAFEWRGPSGWGLFTSAEFTARTDATRVLSGRAGGRYSF